MPNKTKIESELLLREKTQHRSEYDEMFELCEHGLCKKCHTSRHFYHCMSQDICGGNRWDPYKSKENISHCKAKFKLGPKVKTNVSKILLEISRTKDINKLPLFKESFEDNKNRQ